MSVQDEHGYHDANARKEPALTAIRCTVPANPDHAYKCQHHPIAPYGGHLCPAHQKDLAHQVKVMSELKAMCVTDSTDYSDPEGMVKDQFRVGMAIGRNMGLGVQYEPQAAGPTPSRYRWTFKGVTFDFYRLCEVIGVKRGPAQHALKKIIRAGLSIKPVEQEIDEAIDALLRWKEMIQEDNEA